MVQPGMVKNLPKILCGPVVLFYERCFLKKINLCSCGPVVHLESLISSGHVGCCVRERYGVVCERGM